MRTGASCLAFRAGLATVALLPLAACVGTADSGVRTPTSAPSECRVTRVVDGDTVHLNCGGDDMKARLVGFDTPEIFSPKCREEQAAGYAATRFLKDLVRSGPVTRADFDGRDRYGRELVRLEIAGMDVSNEMVAAGLAVRYAGHRRPDWCSILERTDAGA